MFQSFIAQSQLLSQWVYIYWIQKANTKNGVSYIRDSQCKTAYKQWSNRDARVRGAVNTKFLDEKLPRQEPKFMRHRLLSIDRMLLIYAVNILVCQTMITHTSNAMFSSRVVNGSTSCHVMRIMKSIKRRTATMPNNWWSRIITCRETQL